MAKNLSTKDSIQSLSPLEFTRLRPGVYAGSTEYSTQLLIEIVSNAIDEHKAGYCNLIKVTVEDDFYQVEDNGRGFPVNELRKDGKTTLQAAFDTLNTSGKFSEDGAYEGTSLGLNGIGSKLTNYLSHWLEVISYNNKKYEKVKFREGVFESRDLGDWLNSKPLRGTIVTWQPSEEFFVHSEVDIKRVKELFKVLVCLCPTLTIELYDHKKKEIFKSKKGLNDLVDEYVGKNEIVRNRLNINFENGRNKLDMVLTYSSNYSFTIVPYVNTGETDSGPHITQIKTILTRELNKFFKDKKWLKDKEIKLSGEDLQEGMLIVFNLTAPNIAYDAQTKSRITKIDMTPFNSTISNSVRQWLEDNEKDIKVIFEKALTAKKAKEAAKKAREKTRNQKTKEKKKVLKFDSKLADCSMHGKQAEIMVTEGDSASGNLKLARDNRYQAVLPVRGKILNVRKASLEKIQKNAEIMTMIEAFGLTVDLKTMKLTFKEEDLRYGKIIIMSDADVDGSHIKNLFYTFIWTFCPDLIKKGCVYAGIPPLYRVTENKNKYVYLKNDAALEEYRKEHPNKKLVLTRMKGLGELDAEETKILVDPELRIINQVTVKDAVAADKLFDDLMGDDVIPRKEYIKEHSIEAQYQL